MRSRGKEIKSVLEYKVRWVGKWNDPRYDSWTNKDNINEECIREFDGDVLSVGERLATVPAALHPSHPGYAAAMRMSAMASQVVVIQHRSGPKRRQPSQLKQSSAVTKSGGEEVEQDGITHRKSNSHSDLTTDAQGAKPSGCSNESSRAVSSPGEMEQDPSEGKDSCTELTLAAVKTPVIIQTKRIFDESTLEGVARWVDRLDKVVRAGREADPTFASMYNSFFTKVQKQSVCMTAVAQWEEHRLEDGEDLIEITSAGWSFTWCPDHVSSQK